MKDERGHYIPRVYPNQFTGQRYLPIDCVIPPGLIDIVLAGEDEGDGGPTKKNDRPFHPFHLGL